MCAATAISQLEWRSIRPSLWPRPPGHEKETDMANTDRTRAAERAPMDSMRKTALVAGLLYLLTFISIPRLILFGPVLNDPNFILSSASDTGVLWGIVLE